VDFRVDRRHDVPLGTQLAWKLRGLVASGQIAPGQRLPSIRELAKAAGVNVNTARAVYRRLEDEGVLSSEQGRGTFVAESVRPSDELERVVADAEADARGAGVDPRVVAARLYALSGGGARPAGRRADAGEAAERRRLRREIAELEAELVDHGLHSLGPAPGGAPNRPAGTLLTAEELTEVRDRLLERLQALDAARAEVINSREDRRRGAPALEGRDPGRRSTPSLSRARVRWIPGT
jgi:DNA-binding transcriptional regulator YhcF (GntR family)